MPFLSGRRAGLLALALLGAVGCDDTQFNTLEVEVSGEGYDAVLEVMEGNCTSCHSADGTASFLDLSTESFCDSVLDGRLVVPGDAAGSVLYQRITDAGSPMPPTGQMSEGNQSIVGDWIDAGAECDGGGGADGADGSDGGSTDGAALFDSGCAGCHGADGDSGYAPDLSDEVPGKALDDIIEVVQQGEGDMPAIYTDATQAEAVAQYVLDTFAR
jgi:mono/diheme cytochrome c family protein